MKLIRTILLPVLFVAMWSLTGCNEEPMTSVTPDNTQGLSKLTIPAGAVVTNATFFIYVEDEQNRSIDVHKVNVPWDENTETYNTFNSKTSPQFDPAVLGSFTALNGFQGVDITALVQAWLAGTTPNNGVLLNQSVVEPGLITFWSKDHAGGVVAPYIRVTYTPAGGGTPVVVTEKAYADTWISNLAPNTNYGSDPIMVLGKLNSDYIKYVLVKFDIEPAVQRCETAYAFGTTPFCGLPDIGNWGWTRQITGNFTGTNIPIYAGAGQCNPNKGIQVGTLSISYVGTSLTVNYTMNSGVTVNNVHMWIGNTPLPVKNGKLTSAPGQFNYNNQTFPFNLTRSQPFYIAVHFDVCWFE